MKSDTIAAIATALSDSGIGIIRVSGEASIEIVNHIFRTPGGKKKLLTVDSHTIHYGYIVDKDIILEKDDWKNNIIDEVMVTVFKAPKSYTAENTIEINCHGGVLVMKKLLEVVLSHGARMAEPGEFTKRAFLNGRLDLSRAEAVMDIIHSRNQYALKASVSQLSGELSKIIRYLREKILYEIAYIESALDDPEHISLEGYTEQLEEKVKEINDILYKLIISADNGRLLKEGISTVIVGKPNAGKSSLLNVLIGEERAIVTDIAGTTRDALQEYIQIRGIGLHIIDTAGIRNTSDKVEQIGVERAIKFAQDADLILYVVDASVELDESDRKIISMLGDKKTIILLNKSDLHNIVDEENLSLWIKDLLPDSAAIEIIKTSTRDGAGIEQLEDTLQKMFFQGELQNNQELVITNLRHKEALQDAYDSMQMVLKSIEDGMPEDFYSIDLMSAYSALGLIIGEEVGDDLVEEIFSKFCMGK